MEAHEQMHVTNAEIRRAAAACERLKGVLTATSEDATYRFSLFLARDLRP